MWCRLAVNTQLLAKVDNLFKVSGHTCPTLSDIVEQEQCAIVNSSAGRTGILVADVAGAVVALFRARFLSGRIHAVQSTPLRTACVNVG